MVFPWARPERPSRKGRLPELEVEYSRAVCGNYDCWMEGHQATIRNGSWTRQHAADVAWTFSSFGPFQSR